MGLFRYPPSDRLRHAADYERVKRRGRRVRSAHFRVTYAPNNTGGHRLGLVVQKRFWNAVQRNRIKRTLREFFRLEKHRIGPPAKDIVILAMPGAEKLHPQAIASEILAVLMEEGQVAP